MDIYLSVTYMSPKQSETHSCQTNGTGQKSRYVKSKAKVMQIMASQLLYLLQGNKEQTSE